MNLLSRLRDSFETLNIDGILVNSSTNRRYLTGFTGTAGIVLISKNDARLLTDFRYTKQAEEQVDEFTVKQIEKNNTSEIAKHLQEMGIAKLGFEEEHLTYAQHKNFQNTFAAKLVPTKLFVESFRMQKSSQEIKFIKEAVNVTDEAFNHILQVIKIGMTEQEVANELEQYIKTAGFAPSKSSMVVASGARSALPHGIASDKKIENGDMVTMDFGALSQDYCSDMTRTVSVGEPPSQLKEIYSIVHKALAECLNSLKPNLTIKELDHIIREPIEKAGYGEKFGHGAGHGIGLDVHEELFITSNSTKRLLPNMVMTIEPGIYIPGLGGVRIEDDVLITENGCEVLTMSPKNLIVL
ncbi:M24 family metallopeptidase [Natribacillus halophilus]|uniref:Xaa-Pro aminopeptidase n=1 Tax=Natribacillus halophilus TaxID=549003 RepID=A0A1G8R8Z0_9BACI|nr:Xaa-Pro peptidase family protein [Natribacillus halophilus]SDJ12995.1 Xaa-Pro aminopeptidase [Natribacillus halophilus]